MTAVARKMPEPLCSDCEKPIKLGERIVCRDCETEGQDEAFDNGVANEKEEGPNVVQELREWAGRRFLFGHITREVRDALLPCADDIDVNHG